MEASETKIGRRLRRRRHIRHRLGGTAERPRLQVFRSNKNIYAQIIDDLAGRTLVSASTLDKELRDQLSAGAGNKAAAERVGTALAEKAVQHGIKKVAFDRSGYKFHGRLKALAQAARKVGLEF